MEPRNHLWSRVVARLQLVMIGENKSPSAPPCGRLWVDVDRLGAVRRELEALSRRGKRLGTGAIELRALGERDGEVEVEIRGAAPQLGGYRVVATLRHEGGETTLEPVPGEEGLEDSEWAAADPWCEHCAVRRRCHVTYLLRGDRELVQVGSSCLGDFTGEHDPARAARQAQLLAQARRETAGRGLIVDDAPGDLVPLGDFLSWVCELAAQGGFRSRRRARENGVEATGDRAWERMHRARASAGARATASRVIRWAPPVSPSA
jgi:hypothetical protein